MKTLLVTAFLAVAIGACSSDNSSTLVTSSAGTVPQGGACSSSSDCEPNGGLSCAYPVNDAGTTCPTQGVCVSLGPISVYNCIPCGGKVPVSVEVTPNYSSVPLGGAQCPLPNEDGGTTTTPTGGSDASTGTTTPQDSGTKSTTDASGGSTTGG